MFVFVGAGSAVASQYVGVFDPGSMLVVAALANGLGLAIGISITMGISGGALNPAVTIGLLLGKKIRAKDVIPYIIAELVGATIAGLLLMAVSPSSVGNAAHWGAPSLSSADRPSRRPDRRALHWCRNEPCEGDGPDDSKPIIPELLVHLLDRTRHRCRTGWPYLQSCLGEAEL